MAFNGNKGVARIIKAMQFSAQGFSATYRHEEAFRQEVWLSVILLPTGLIVGDTAVEKALLVGSVLVLLLVEILNSALEAVVDRFGQELHELSGRAKDMGSAAVFLAIVNLVTTWLLLLFI